ncbi:MAG: hypothetical protein QME92_00510 [Bacillota bacterium]|nr:hypothetical protein [Bacillota bacterium]
MAIVMAKGATATGTVIVMEAVLERAAVQEATGGRRAPTVSETLRSVAKSTEFRMLRGWIVRPRKTCIAWFP